MEWYLFNHFVRLRELAFNAAELSNNHIFLFRLLFSFQRPNRASEPLLSGVSRRCLPPRCVLIRDQFSVVNTDPFFFRSHCVMPANHLKSNRFPDCEKRSFLLNTTKTGASEVLPPAGFRASWSNCESVGRLPQPTVIVQYHLATAPGPGANSRRLEPSIVLRTSHNRGVAPPASDPSFPVS
jgi:hypothetical protein